MAVQRCLKSSIDLSSHTTVQPSICNILQQHDNSTGIPSPQKESLDAKQHVHNIDTVTLS